MVRVTGFEPVQLLPLPPQDSVSTIPPHSHYHNYFTIFRKLFQYNLKFFYLFFSIFHFYYIDRYHSLIQFFYIFSFFPIFFIYIYWHFYFQTFIRIFYCFYHTNFRILISFGVTVFHSFRL